MQQAMPDVLASEACFQVGGPRDTVLVDLPASQLGSSWGRTGDPVKARCVNVHRARTRSTLGRGTAALSTPQG